LIETNLNESYNEVNEKDSIVNESAEFDITVKEVKDKPKRLVYIDYIRSIGILMIIFIHGIVYSYGLFDTLDLENLNPFFMIIYVVLNWAGLFAVISALVNTYSSYNRLKNTEEHEFARSAWRIFGKRWLFLGFFFLCLNFLYSFLISPFFYDFGTKTTYHSFLPGIIRTGGYYQVAPEKILTGSTFAMLGWNLIILGLVFTLLFRKKANFNKKWKRIFILILGIVIILISFCRIWFFDDFENAIQNGKYGLAYLIDMISGSYFPLLPYLGYGLIGSYLGLVLADNPTKKTLRRQIWIGVGFFVGSVIAFLIPDAAYAQIGLLDDIFLSYITNLFEISFYIIIGVIIILISNRRKNIEPEAEVKESKGISRIILNFSKNSLTFFLLERIIAELFGLLMETILPDWNNYIWSCLLFGGFLVLFWIGISILWSLANFKFSFEWWLVKFFQKIKYKSNKSY